MIIPEGDMCVPVAGSLVLPLPPPPPLSARLTNSEWKREKSRSPPPSVKRICHAVSRDDGRLQTEEERRAGSFVRTGGARLHAWTTGLISGSGGYFVNWISNLLVDLHAALTIDNLSNKIVTTATTTRN